MHNLFQKANVNVNTLQLMTQIRQAGHCFVLIGDVFVDNLSTDMKDWSHVRIYY